MCENDSCAFESPLKLLKCRLEKVELCCQGGLRSLIGLHSQTSQPSTSSCRSSTVSGPSSVTSRCARRELCTSITVLVRVLSSTLLCCCSSWAPPVLLVHAAQNAPQWLSLIAPDALELAVTLGTRPISRAVSGDTDWMGPAGEARGKEASVLTAALELSLIVLAKAKFQFQLC